jgi:hypothetical protein
LPLFSGYGAPQGQRTWEFFTGDTGRFPLSMQMHCDDPWLERDEYLEERELDLEDVCKRVCEELFVVFHHGFLKFRKNL